ncbi:MAG TPA: TMEM175 family protein [Pyrinomonadaceae bacterium]|nr:TMEM175 family protein [Pyrinomonadaceae bacterium]
MEHDRRALQLERIVFFSDAVFAIAITLLIIEVKVPHLEPTASERDFAIALVKLIPNFVGYFFSFLVIGAYWVGHHKIYGHIVDWNYGLVWRNVFFLLMIAFMPFTTAFFSEYVTHVVPTVLYASAFALAGVLEIVLWRYAIKSGLTDPTVDRRELDHLTWRMSVLPVIGLLAIAIGFIQPMFAGMAFALIPVAHRVIGAKFRKEQQKFEESLEVSEMKEHTDGI